MFKLAFHFLLAGLKADVHRDLYSQQHRILVGTAPIHNADVILPFKGTYVHCKIPSTIPEPENPLDKAFLLDSAIQVIDEIKDCMEHNNGDFIYSICPKKDIVQRFSTDLRDSEGLTDLEWKIIKNIRYKLGTFSVIPPTNVPYFNLHKPAGSYLSAGIDGTFRLKQLWGSGDICEEFSCGPALKVMSVNEYSICLYTMHIKIPQLCEIEGFAQREISGSGNIECYVDKAVLDSLDPVELKRWRLDGIKENFVLFS
ncbi:hypothetical protein HDV01_002939 [Terramyces sp. JEL0728]|nr:hypothetical protein HDV01_002939 [Terramyces sp. JEL0728]